MRRTQTENVPRYVSNKTGDDANDGSSLVSPLRTIQRAIDLIVTAASHVGINHGVVATGGIEVRSPVRDFC